MSDSVNHPKHYNVVPNIECIDIVRELSFNTGNVIKYIWRAGIKDDAKLDIISKELEDLKKAEFYLNDEIKFNSSSLKKDFLNKTKNICIEDVCKHFNQNKSNIILNVWKSEGSFDSIFKNHHLHAALYCLKNEIKLMEKRKKDAAIN